MELDSKLAILHTSQPFVSQFISENLTQEQQESILSNGGKITLKSGKSPNGMVCTLIARIKNDLTAIVVAVSDNGQEQQVGSVNVAKVFEMIK